MTGINEFSGVGDLGWDKDGKLRNTVDPKLVMAWKKIADQVNDAQLEINKIQDRIKDIPEISEAVVQQLIDTNTSEQIEIQAEKSVNKYLKDLWPNIISVFGIFASFTTFVLGEVQVYRVYCDPLQILGLSLLFACVLITFILLLLTFYRPINLGENSSFILGVAYGLILLIGSVSFATGTFNLAGYNGYRCYDGGVNIRLNNTSNSEGTIYERD